MRISDWSSDVCSSDLVEPGLLVHRRAAQPQAGHHLGDRQVLGSLSHPSLLDGLNPKTGSSWKRQITPMSSRWQSLRSTNHPTVDYSGGVPRRRPPAQPAWTPNQIVAHNISKARLFRDRKSTRLNSSH